MVWLTDAETPPSLRLYVIGDVHGCIDDLRAVHTWIADDLAERPAADWRIVHLGDFVDRGPDSAAVIQHIVICQETDPRFVSVLGNHDYMFEQSMDGNHRMQQIWLQNGGLDTLASYGLSRDALRDPDAAIASGAVPQRHLDFIRSLPTSLQFGDYYFVHAGIHPRVPLDRQDSDAMLWIREPFLDDGREYDAVIVHGHTPTRRIDVRSNRIGIDTGAVYGGVLTCLVLDGPVKCQLRDGQRRPVF